VGAECLVCLIERGYHQACNLTEDPEIRKKIMLNVLNALEGKFTSDAMPAALGSVRDKAVKSTVKRDPYRELKIKAGREALALLPSAEHYISAARTPYLRFRRACTLSIVANAMEFDVRGFRFNFRELREALKKPKLAVDHLKQAYNILKDSNSILYLTDNAGEIIFDTLLLKQLKDRGLKVTVAVKEHPVLNDATLKEAKEAGVDKIVDELITTGSNSVGLIWEEASNNVKQAFKGSDLVIAKGMGNYETLTELKCMGAQILFLLKAKCNPIARSIGVKIGANVALLRR
jgi:uncharacterized protein with ATP-grasp and redox domains